MKECGVPLLPPGDSLPLVPRDHGVIAECWTWLDNGGRSAGNAFPRDVSLEGAWNLVLLGGKEGIAALHAAIVEVAAEAVSRARGCRIRALEVGVRVIRRSSQRGCESRSGWHSSFRNWRVVFAVRRGRRRRCDRGRLCGSGSSRRRRLVVVDITFLDGNFCARRCHDVFDLGARIPAATRVDRVSASPRGPAGRDGVATFSRTFGHPAGHTRGFARARAGHNRRAFALTFWAAGPGLPLSFTIRCERILQLFPHANISAIESYMDESKGTLPSAGFATPFVQSCRCAPRYPRPQPSCHRAVLHHLTPRNVSSWETKALHPPLLSPLPSRARALPAPPPSLGRMSPPACSQWRRNAVVSCAYRHHLCGANVT